MVRAQIQFTEEQLEALRRLSASTKRSVADLVREGVDTYLQQQRSEREKRVRRALKAVGRFGSGSKDVSENHDRYLAEAFRR